jgi:hypothetical protein
MGLAPRAASQTTDDNSTAKSAATALRSALPPFTLQRDEPLTPASILLSAALISSQLAPAVAAETGHWAYLQSVSTYKPTAGFNHIVGPIRFVGYFVSAPDGCRVTVFTAGADDEALVQPPRRIEFDLPAGSRNEIPAGEGSALAIACTADADAIKVAPQRLPIAPGDLEAIGHVERAPL